MSPDTIQKQAPLFIVFDGMDGTGKTTQMRLLAERLSAEGIPVELTAEPTDMEYVKDGTKKFWSCVQERRIPPTTIIF